MIGRIYRLSAIGWVPSATLPPPERIYWQSTSGWKILTYRPTLICGTSFPERGRMLLSGTRWWPWISKAQTPPPHCSCQEGHFYECNLGSAVACLRLLVHMFVGTTECLTRHCQCSAYSLKVFVYIPKMLPAVSTCSLIAFASTMRTRPGSLNRLSLVFLCTLSHFIISPLIGSGYINSHMYPSRDWFTCLTYKVNAASGDPRGASCCRFPGSYCSNARNWQV